MSVEQLPAGLYPEHWQAAITGLSRLRSEVQALNHPLITTRLLPVILVASEEARRYRDACLEEGSAQ